MSRNCTRIHICFAWWWQRQFVQISEIAVIHFSMYCKYSWFATLLRMGEIYEYVFTRFISNFMNLPPYNTSWMLLMPEPVFQPFLPSSLHVKDICTLTTLLTEQKRIYPVWKPNLISFSDKFFVFEQSSFTYTVQMHNEHNCMAL